MDKKIFVYLLVFFSMTLFFVKDHFAYNDFDSGEEGRQKDFCVAGLEKNNRELKEAINKRKQIREKFKNRIESIEKEQESSNKQERYVLEQEKNLLRQKRDCEKIRLAELQGQSEVLQGAIDFVKKHKEKVNFLMGNLSDASGWLVMLHESAKELLERNYDLSSEPDGFLNSEDRIEQLVEDLRATGKEELALADKLEGLNNGTNLTESEREVKEELEKYHYLSSDEPGENYLGNNDKVKKLVEAMRTGGEETLEDANKLERVKSHIVYWKNKKNEADAAASKYLENDFFSK